MNAQWIVGNFLLVFRFYSVKFQFSEIHSIYDKSSFVKIQISQLLV